MSHSKVSFNVVRAHNDGRPVDPEIIAELEHDLNTMFGGFTIEGDRTGVWHGQREVSAWYSVYVLPQNIDALRRRVRALRVRLEQEAIAFEISAATIELLDENESPDAPEPEPKKKKAKKKKPKQEEGQRLLNQEDEE